jgi:hypothetical protein
MQTVTSFLQVRWLTPFPHLQPIGYNPHRYFGATSNGISSLLGSPISGSRFPSSSLTRTCTHFHLLSQKVTNGRIANNPTGLLTGHSIEPSHDDRSVHFLHETRTHEFPSAFPLPPTDMPCRIPLDAYRPRINFLNLMVATRSNRDGDTHPKTLRPTRA